jgi:RIO-like serine/threonine protein kinase
MAVHKFLLDQQFIGHSVGLGKESSVFQLEKRFCSKLSGHLEIHQKHLVIHRLGGTGN